MRGEAYWENVDYNIVTSHISHIREKIEDDSANPIYIQTVWGVGYRFNNNLRGYLFPDRTRKGVIVLHCETCSKND